ncbi:MAG: DUF3048 C-terminal domain-containing protein, partial [Defluviitaleaceae bacterium]|nr:DUF3048 C-terminal domain-containing protein [Defluviitaleaceae bacterium]
YYKFLGTRTFRQIDEETGEQLAVTNVLIQLVRSHIIAGDPEGRRNVTTVGSGEGYLLTGGEYVPVRWTKTSQQSPTRWYDLLGNPLRLNTGRTWICVHTGDVEFDTGDDADD